MYLIAWENVASFSFTASSKKEAGAALTMAGLKYMLLLLPSVWERAIQLQHNFDQQFIEDTLKKFITSIAVERDSFFTCDENKMCFRDRI